MQQENNSTPSDEQLVEAIKQNEPEAFRVLYYKYFTPLIRFALYRTHSMETAKELVQEMFTRIWIKKDFLDPRKPVKSYLYKSLSNLIINRRKLHSSQATSLESKQNSKIYNDEDNMELMIDIRNAMDALPEKIKTVYLLSRVEGFRYEEIAEICCISEKAVEKRMSKAFSLLRKTFSEKYFK